MKTKLLFFMLCFFAITSFQAQITSVAIVGEAVGGWPGNPGNPGPSDVHQMTSTDGVNWNISNLVVTTAVPQGGAKFRANNDWVINWGDAAFPNGTGTQNGPNILTVGNTYNVAFNSTTGVYSFTISNTFPSIGIWGPAVDPINGFAGPDVDMSTLDGVAYTLNNYNFTSGTAKFRQGDSNNINWASTAFPTGTGVQDGPNFTVTGGQYNVTFNRTTGEYNFSSNLGVANFSKKTSKVYPNPSYNNWNFVSSLNAITAIQIVDVSGKIVFETKELSNNVIVNATDLSSGIYFAKVFSSDGIQTIKVVKN